MTIENKPSLKKENNEGKRVAAYMETHRDRLRVFFTLPVLENRVRSYGIPLDIWVNAIEAMLTMDEQMINHIWDTNDSDHSDIRERVIQHLSFIDYVARNALKPPSEFTLRS